MAVYTDVAADELADYLGQYDIGELLSYKGIAEGVENSNFLLHTSCGSFILTLYEKRVAKGDLPFFLGLMTHLAAHGINCPQPVMNRKGEALGALAGRPAAIITFLSPGLRFFHQGQFEGSGCEYRPISAAARSSRQTRVSPPFMQGFCKC